MTTRLAIIGDGKMGQAIRDLAHDADCEVVAFLGEKEVAASGPTPSQLAGAAVAIEFTVPAAAAANIQACARARIPVVSGTTGWEHAREATEKIVRDADGAMLWSPNFSIGVQIFARIVEQASREVARARGTLAAHLVETHHAQKKDAPSGTAKMLSDRMREGLGGPPPITSVRTGSVPGTHEVIFDGAFEQIRLVHEARDRRVFAAGALAAAKWIVGKRGIFTMDDFLGVR
jgi:4-hydroxy-tetrahydrodipicolinate reductase